MKRTLVLCLLALIVGSTGLQAQGIGLAIGQATVSSSFAIDLGPWGLSFRPDRSSPWEFLVLANGSAPPPDATHQYSGNEVPSKNYSRQTGIGLSVAIDYRLGGGPLWWDGLTWFWGTGASGCVYFKNNPNPSLENPGTGVAWDLGLRLFPGLNWALFDDKVDLSFQLGVAAGVQVNYEVAGWAPGLQSCGGLGLRYWL